VALAGIPETSHPSHHRAAGGINSQVATDGWWAHLKFTCINIKLTILRKKIEDLREVFALLSIAS
jgi:hypothetical protein